MTAAVFFLREQGKAERAEAGRGRRGRKYEKGIE